MGNSSAQTLEDVECISLEKFKNKETTPRKMTIHVLSSSKINCIDFVEALTLKKVPENAKELLEKNIQTKLTLFSFMNYKMYDSVNDLMEAIKKKSKSLIINPKSEEVVYSEVVVVLDNKDINEQIEKLNEEINDKPIQTNGEETVLSAFSYYVPFLIFLSSNHLDLSKFIPSKTFQYRISLEDILNFKKDLDNLNGKKEDKEKDKKIEDPELIEKNFDKKKNIELIDKIKNTKLESIIPTEEINTNVENEEEQSLIEEKDKNLENKIQINENDRRIEKEYLEFVRKLKSLFSYYNELGDIFSFKNSQNQEELVLIEDGKNFPVYINILLLGKSGSGKSTLINLLLDEKKSIEGGNGFSTTSKNIIIFKKRNKPLRFYDVKGIENKETIENYLKILEKFNGKNSESIDRINAIFYCIEYTNGTIVEQMVNIVFENLIKYEIPIIFIITHCQIDYNKKSENKKIQQIRNSTKAKIENAIKAQLRSEFKNINKENECDKFIENFVEFKYVNLVRIYEPPTPVFGIDSITSFFTEKVNAEYAEFWKTLKEKCLNNDEEECKKLCQQNPFLKSLKNFNHMNEENKNKALNYLKGLKAGAFFSGWIPFFDMGMEYYYRNQFKEKLKNLYGYDYETAKKVLKEIIKEKEEKMKKLEEGDIELINLIENEDKKQKIPQNNKKEEKDSEYSNKGRNFGGIIRGLIDSGHIIIKIIESGGRLIFTGVVGWVLLPSTILGSGIWSYYNIHNDCNKILNVFYRTFDYFKITNTLLTYSDSFQTAIEYLGDIGKKIIDESNENEEN